MAEAPAPPPAPKKSTNRMMYLMPLLFLMNRVDFSNPQILWPARIAFVVAQLLSLGVFFIIQRRVRAKNDTRKIFVPGVKSPFDQSPDFSQVTESTYVEYESKKCDEFIKQTLIGAAIASFVHLKMGVNQVVLIQAVMAPMNLYDNPLVRPWLFGKARDGRLWNERLEGEALDVPSASPEPQDTKSTSKDATSKDTAKPKAKKDLSKVTPAEAIAQALAQEADADFEDVWEVVKRDVNAATAEDKWTALMVACGSPLDTDAFIRKMVQAGADVEAQDSEGWTALHWSAFHGRPEAAETLLNCTSASQRTKLLEAKDANGRTALAIAEEEGNGDVVEVLKGKKEEEEEEATLRQRKGKASTVEDVD